MILIPALLSSVTRPVMQAALGMEDPCDGVGNKNKGFETKEYDWNYDVGQKLTYYVKKGGPASITNYDFMIEFEDGKPRVWVEDANEWKDRLKLKCREMTVYGRSSGTAAQVSTCDVDCQAIKDIIRPSDEYRNYLLSVKVYGHECEGLRGYGTAFQQSLDNMIRDWWKIGAAYSVPCAITTVACSARLGVFTGGTTMISGVKSAMFDCTMAPAITMLGYKLAQSRSLLEGHSSVAWILGAGSPASVGTVRTTIETLIALKRIDTLQKIATGSFEKALTPDEIRKLAKDTYNLIEKLRKLGVLNIRDDEIEPLKKIALAEGTAQQGATELTGELKSVDWENLKKNIKNIRESVTSRSALKSFGCRVAGGVIGTLSWYTLVETGIKVPKVNVQFDSISPALNITTGGKEIIIDNP